MRAITLSALLTLLCLGTARAGDVVIVSAAAVRMPLEKAASLAPSAIGEHLVMSFGTAGVVQARVESGDAVDIVVLPPPRLDDLAAKKLLAGDGRFSLGTVRLGLAVRAGAPRPAIATEDEVRTTLLSAATVGVADPASGATTGIFFGKLFDRMGLAEPLKPRLRLFPDGTAAMEALARGELALAAGQVSEIQPVAGVDLVGPLPDALQLRTVYTASVAAHSPRPEAARAVIAFLRSAQMAPAFAAAGFDPPSDSANPALSR